jgi:hypothetical protein
MAFLNKNPNGKIMKLSCIPVSYFDELINNKKTISC